MKRKTANNEYLNEYFASKTKINNTGIFCCYFSTSFHSANPNFGLRPKLGGQISLLTERKDSAKRLIQKVKSLSDICLSVNIVASLVIVLCCSCCSAFITTMEMTASRISFLIWCHPRSTARRKTTETTQVPGHNRAFHWLFSGAYSICHLVFVWSCSD